MKRSYTIFLIFFVMFLTETYIYAQVNGFNYKAVIYNNELAVSNQAVNLQFTYFDGTNQQYQETFTTTTSNSGIVIVNMGEGTVVSGLFSLLDFSHQITYKVEVNLGSGYTNMGTYNFKTVPTAIYAQSAASLSTELSLNDLSDGKTDDYSLFIGTNTGNSDDGNNYNVGVGQNCLVSNISGFNNVAVGAGAMGANGSGSQNTAIGSNTLFINQSGSGNTAIGYAALNASDGGLYNTAVGYGSILLGGDGDYNVALGNNSLRSADGNNNTAVGTGAGYSNTSGSQNVFIGYGAGYNNVSGSTNVFLGYNAGNAETGSNKLYIDNSNTAFPLIHGDFATNQLTINGGLSVKNGTQGEGKVFTSDANGLGSWQNTEKSHTVFLNPAMAQPMSNTVDYSRSWGSFHITSATTTSVIIPLDLPVGATVTQVTYYFVDNTSSASIRFSAYMTTISNGSSGVTASYSSTNTSTAVQEYTPVLGGFEIVADKIYSFVIDANGAAWPGNSTLSIRGIKVIYTY
jgi:hypothetical protein